MSGTGSNQPNYESNEGSGTNKLSSDDDPATASSSLFTSRFSATNLPELFKGFYIQRPDMHLHWDSWTEPPEEQAQPPKVEEKPFVFEEPETDFHLQVTKDLLEEQAERNLVTDDRGVPIHDCRGDHPTGSMCQFCDGRRGSWVHPNAKSSKLFQQYQESVLSSPQEFCTDVASRDSAAGEDRYTLDFGLFDRKFYE